MAGEGRGWERRVGEEGGSGGEGRSNLPDVLVDEIVTASEFWPGMSRMVRGWGSGGVEGGEGGGWWGGIYLTTLSMGPRPLGRVHPHRFRSVFGPPNLGLV